jgi:hypothetical protein
LLPEETDTDREKHRPCRQREDKNKKAREKNSIK